MIITVLGANGQTGVEVVRQVIEADHSMHAVVRQAESLPPRTGLKVFVGGVTDPAVIARPRRPLTRSSRPWDRSRRP
jgi:uncharacterized protein YbjT (DUF2867 family)